MLLPLAKKKVNVLHGARQLGYEPVQKISYSYEIVLYAQKNPDYGMNDGEPGYNTLFTYTIPKYTAFESGGNTYYYFGNDISITVSNKMIDDEDIRSFVYMHIKEGELIRFEDDDLLRQRTFNIVNEEGEVEVKQNYLIPYNNVEQKGLEVFLTYIDEQGIEHFRKMGTVRLFSNR
jgi:hypothetical protein